MSTEQVSTGSNELTEQQKAKLVFKELLASVPANPADLKFPTDKWGFTSGIRKEVLRAAAAVRGADEKHELLVMTLAILIQHIHARKAKDAANHAETLERRRKAAEGRAIRETFSGSLVDPARVSAEVTAPISN